MRKLLVFIFLALPVVAFAQSERGDVREGNKLYGAKDYKGAELKYRSALQLNGDSYGAMSNLGSALFKQKLSGESQEIFKKVVQAAEKVVQAAENGSVAELAAAYYNLGNSYLQERKLDEAIESYKSSLRLNPSDELARFNLAYAQKLKKEDEGGGGQSPQPKDQPQNQPEDQDKDQKEQPQPKPESRQDAERMLNALQDAENKTKEKVDKQEKKGERGSSKQW